MTQDNTTPMSAGTYDQEINRTIPYYSEFYPQVFDVIEQYGFSKMRWLDLGCGTGSLEEAAPLRFSDVQFVLVDPSEKMLEKAKEKLAGQEMEYICADSCSIDFYEKFDVVTAIQSHHYMREDERKKATENVFRALKQNGIYLSFENVVSDDREVKEKELHRWGRYQQRQGKSVEEAKAHMARCGVNYFPLTVAKHIELLKQTGFRHVHVFWLSYMQMGIYGVK